MRVLQSAACDVSVLDVAPVLAQMQGDAVGARLLGEQRGVHGSG